VIVAVELSTGPSILGAWITALVFTVLSAWLLFGRADSGEGTSAGNL
jgi:isoprenylcysteine carboxyl methyltransferase (ICMT) family protein YpbQ